MTETSNPVSNKELTTILGVSTQTVSNWVKTGMPVSGQGRGAKYDTVLCVQWLKNYWINEALRRNQKPVGDDIEDAEYRKVNAEARLKELKVARELGTMVTVEDAQGELQAWIEPLRRKINAIPSSWAQFVTGIKDTPTAISVLKERVQRLLEELSSTEPDAINEFPLDEVEDLEDEPSDD